MVKELDEQQIRPRLAQLPRLGGIRNIRQVEHHLANHSLVDIRFGIEFFIKYLSLEMPKLLKMIGHIGRKDGADHDGAHPLVLVSVELLKDVVLVGIHFENIECRGQMVVLQH